MYILCYFIPGNFTHFLCSKFFFVILCRHLYSFGSSLLVKLPICHSNRRCPFLKSEISPDITVLIHLLLIIRLCSIQSNLH